MAIFDELQRLNELFEMPEDGIIFHFSFSRRQEQDRQLQHHE
jgi:hypothetical protein